MLMIGDSKLISYPNLAAMHAGGIAFIAPASKTYVPAAVLAGLDLAAARRVDYVARHDAAKAAEERGSWHVTEDSMALAGPRTKDPVLGLRTGVRPLLGPCPCGACGQARGFARHRVGAGDRAQVGGPRRVRPMVAVRSATACSSG